MPREGWVSISIPEEMVDKIKELIERRPDLGYSSISAFATDALRRLFSEYSSVVPRFVHVNTYEDHAVVRDNKIGKEVIIYFRNGGVAYCDYCESTKCEHIDYALTLPEVMEPLEQRGWKSKT
jgi:hypothetical protein